MQAQTSTHPTQFTLNVTTVQIVMLPMLPVELDHHLAQSPTREQMVAVADELTNPTILLSPQMYHTQIYDGV